MKNLLCITALAVATGSAQADIIVNLTNLSLPGTGFQQLVSDLTTRATGTLTGVSVNATLISSTGGTSANDLTIVVKRPPLGFGGMLQVGGNLNLNASEYRVWSNGASTTPGTIVNSTITLNTPLVFTGTSTDPFIWVGNGFFNFPSNSGTWSGSITLIGLTAVPTPGAAALMGLGALAVGRRRR